jgi:SAM-dependent methyltransferase
MKRTLVDDLLCPICCNASLALDADGGIHEDVDIGELICGGCCARWSIRAGVPRLVPPELAEHQRETAEAFGWQWKYFNETYDTYREQFLDWLHPIEPSFFRGKRVLDAGCGNGRHAYLAAKFGASEVVALDLSDAVESAQPRVAGLENVHVVQADLLKPPFRTAEAGGGFDFVYSVGVLHHLPDPREGFRSLLRFVRPGGTIAVWVYGMENNAFTRRFVEQLRRVSTKLPPSLLRGLAWPLAVGFHGAAKGVYQPLRETTAGRRSHSPST